MQTEEPNAASTSRWYALMLLTAVYTINIADRFVMSTLIEPIKAEFALSDTAVGLLTGAALAIFYVSAGIPLGLLADRWNRKRMIAIALGAWSVLTGLCGLAQNFWHLLLLRIGVGIGEAGGTPPSQSLLADEFPPNSRPFAMSLFSLGAAFGAALGASLGGWINDHYGWRAVLLVFGAMGIPLAALVALTLPEPRRGRLDSGVPVLVVSLKHTAVFVRRQKSLLHILAGTTVLTFWGWGLVWWTPAFLMRNHDMSLSQSGQVLGWMHGVGGVLVTLATAAAMKVFAQRDPRYQSWFIAVATLVPTVPSIVAYSTESTGMAVFMLWLFVPMIYLYIGPTMALSQNLVPATMRSQMCAIILFVANVANLVIAPVLIGALSDLLAPRLDDPSQSLRYVLIGASATGFWAAWHYMAAARNLREDLVRAGTAVRN